MDAIRKSSNGSNRYDGAGDYELICRIKSRDETAMATMMQKYSAPVFTAAFRVLRQHSDAQEVTQDVFFALWRFPQRFNAERGSLLTWLVILSRSRALDLLRRTLSNSSCKNDLRLALLGSPAASVESFLPDREILVRELLERLPQKQKGVVQKAFLEGYAFAEIADLQGAPLGTVKNRAKLALRKLRSQLVEPSL